MMRKTRHTAREKEGKPERGVTTSQVTRLEQKDGGWKDQSLQKKKIDGLPDVLNIWKTTFIC